MSQIPQPLDGPNKMGIVTPEGNLIVIDDDNGELNLHFNGPVKCSFRERNSNKCRWGYKHIFW